MTADRFGLWTLLGYGGVALVLVGKSIAQCEDGWRVWLLQSGARLYAAWCFGIRRDSNCPISPEEGGLVVANHRSPVDPMLVWMAAMGHVLASHKKHVPMIDFLTAREYCEMGGTIGFICQNMKCIPVDRDGRDMASAKEALRRLQQGRVVGIFPEGKINEGRGLLPGNTGVAWLALRGGVPVYPVFIQNAPKGKDMIEPFFDFGKVRVTFGPAIDLRAYLGKPMNPDLMREVTDLIMDRLGALEEPELIEAEVGL